MLISLRLTNFAVVEEAEASFGAGLTVLTGETGAGKSILVDALGLLLGGRAEAEIVRAGAEEAVIEGLFGRTRALAERLAELGLPDDDPQVSVRRIVGRGGRGKVYVNGALVTVGVLGRLMKGLVDIAGQHEHMTLLDPAQHLHLVDRFGGLDGEGGPLDVYRVSWGRLRDLEARLEALGGDEGQARARADFLRFQLEEIDRVAPAIGEDVRIDAERRRLASTERLRQTACQAEELLSARDGAAMELVGRALALVSEAEKVDPTLERVRSSLAVVQGELDTAVRNLSRYLGSIEADPRRLAELEERLDALRRLCRKHAAPLEGVIERRAALAGELDELEHRAERRAELEAERDRARAQAANDARALGRARRSAARRLTEAVQEGLTRLAMPRARFAAEVEALEEGPAGAPVQGAPGSAAARPPALGRDGADAVQLLFSANAGEPPRALSKVASGGEASRVMLAVKAALAARDACRCSVFDEADAGVGGAVADVVGRMIKLISGHRQVLCITHLPQIAAHADAHLCVEKLEGRGRTRVVVRALEPGEPRTRELARMLSGVEVTEEARGAAAALIEAALRRRPARARKRNRHPAAVRQVATPLG